jgi:chromosome segregation ATPase
MADPRISNGVERLRAFAEQYRALVDLADAFENSQQLESSIATKTAALASLTTEHDALVKTVAAAKSDIAKAHADITTAWADHSARVFADLDKAQAEANAIIAAGKAQADAARTEAAHDVAAQHAAADAALAKKQLALKSATDALVEIHDELAAAKAEHADTAAQTQALRDLANQIIAPRLAP